MIAFVEQFVKSVFDHLNHFQPTQVVSAITGQIVGRHSAGTCPDCGKRFHPVDAPAGSILPCQERGSRHLMSGHFGMERPIDILLQTDHNPGVRSKRSRVGAIVATVNLLIGRYFHRTTGKEPGRAPLTKPAVSHRNRNHRKNTARVLTRCALSRRQQMAVCGFRADSPTASRPSLFVILTGNPRTAADKSGTRRISDMSLSISTTPPTQLANAPTPSPPTAKLAAKTQISQPQVLPDTVTLSLSAQAIQLNQRGQQPPQIAFDLGIPISTVESYLGIAASGGV